MEQEPWETIAWRMSTEKFELLLNHSHGMRPGARTVILQKQTALPFFSPCMEDANMCAGPSINAPARGFWKRLPLCLLYVPQTWFLVVALCSEHMQRILITVHHDRSVVLNEYRSLAWSFLLPLSHEHANIGMGHGQKVFGWS